MMQLTTKEHRVLDMLAKTGMIDWNRVHANTVNALRRKGLVDRHRNLTAVGHAARAAVPNIFNDLFDNKEKTPVPKAKTSVPRKAAKIASKPSAPVVPDDAVGD